MADDRVEIEGAQFLKRRQRGAEMPLHQEVRTEIEVTGVRVEFQGVESGRRQPVASDDPAVIEHYRKLDHAQFVISLAERPALPDPTRIPLDGVPDGMRVCWLCEGTGTLDAGDGSIEDCANCGGDGLVADDAG